MTRIKQYRQIGIQSLLLLLTTLPTIHSQSPFRGISFPELIEPFTTRTYDLTNPQETCYTPLYESDTNQDGKISNDEYTSFVAALSEGEYNATTYADLPFVLKINYIYLSCQCRFKDGAEIDCCEGPNVGLDVGGAGPEEVPTAAEVENLEMVCGETQAAVEYARNESTVGPTGVETGSPTVGPSRSPESPTKSPSASPSNPPTQSPSAEPTSSAPTQSPSAKPTTSAPTQSPSADPSKSPTEPPSLAPSTSQPTSNPTPKPSTTSPTAPPTTVSPSLSPNETPTTDAPTTPEPTQEPTTGPVATPATEAPSPATTKAPTTETGAPTVTPTTAKPTFVQVPTTPRPTIIQVPTTSQPTPAQAPTSPNPTTIPIPTVTTKEPTPKGTQYPSTSIQPSTTKAVIPPSSTDANEPDRGVDAPSPGDEETQSESLSAGGVAGIIIASVIAVYAAVYVYATKKRKREEDDPDLREVRNKDLDDLEAGRGAEGENVETHDSTDGNDPSGGASPPAIITGDPSSPKFSEQTSPGEKSSGSPAPIYEAKGSYDAGDYIPQSSDAGPRGSPLSDSDVPLLSGVPPSPKRTGSFDDSSSAGESGWSSSAGMSSLNTASFDAGTDDGLFLGSPDRLLETIGAANVAAHAAGSTQRDARPTFIPVDSVGSDGSVDSQDNLSPGRSVLQIHSDHPTPTVQGNVTREDLDAAIEAGDWAMVGATAALLADNTSTSSDPSLTDLERQSSKGSPGNSSHSARRAEELDRMVETGNWEGVVLAAAQFEGSTLESGRNGPDSSYSSSSLTPSSRSKEKEELRAEVDRLVRRVVPDEIENIDEMMIQFAGREEELVETLRTMQERSVAQRARAAVQKTATLEAKARAHTAKGPHDSASLSSGPSHYAESANSSVSDYQSHPSPGNNSVDDSITDSSVSDLGMASHDDYSSSRKTAQSSLELAIEKGDWRAVGEAAAMMGEGDSAIIPDESGDSSLSTGFSSLGKQDRVYQLDALISKGDWAGIVAVAGSYQALDDRGGDGGPPAQEEREALAQANMWQEIANQSRQDSSNNAQGALDAADWAISRSLEQKMKSNTDAPASSSDPDLEKNRIEDDESV